MNMAHHQVMWTPGMSIEDLQRNVIYKALSFYHNDKTTVANSLKITIHFLNKKLEQYENEKLAQQKRDEELRKSQEEFKQRARGIACPQPNGYKRVL